MSITWLEHEELTDALIAESKIYDYNQIVCISQAAINRQLEDMHRDYEVLQKQDFRYEDDDIGLINCVLDAPQIKLNTGTNNQQVTYYIHIKTGTLRYYDVWGGESKYVVTLVRWHATKLFIRKHGHWP